MIWKLLYEWWLQLWPNMFAVSVWTSGLFFWHHRSIKRHITKEHEKSRGLPKVPEEQTPEV